MEEATVHLGRNWPARLKTRVGTYGSSGWWWPAHSVTIGGEGGGESGLGHEGVAGIPIVAKTGQRLRQRGTAAEAWGRGRCNRRVGREATLGCPGSCRGRSGGRLGQRRAVGVEVLSRRRRQLSRYNVWDHDSV
jgi:hypothetical protein